MLTIAESFDRYVTLMQELSTSDAPLEELDRRIAAELSELKVKISPYRPERVVELARLACLPWSVDGTVKPGTQGGATKAELLTLLALTMSAGETDGAAMDEDPDSLDSEAHEWAESVGTLIELMQARGLALLRSRPAEDLDLIAFSSRSKEVWLRSTSYPDMVEATYGALFGQENIRAALSAHLGFDAADASAVLTTLHDLQVDAVTNPFHGGFEALAEAFASGEITQHSVVEQALAAMVGWQPTVDFGAVTSAEVAASLERDVDVVEAVLNRFVVDTGEASASEVLAAFVSGDNPLRTNPVVRSQGGKFMLVHDALVLPAIRENLEQELKTLPVWEQYQKWRGTLLEDLGKDALEKILPGATPYSSFHYFVPVSQEEAQGEPSMYTKKVEGDILFILDDVAIIVEAKAVAFTPESRAGESRRLRRDLTGIITNASSQAARLQQRIEEDGGIRLHKGGWLDLGHIREIHTVALSLEDLSGVATATSEVVAAGLLDAHHIPWVVSIHDLQVIAQIVDRPAEFLLYLRRRRDPEVSLAYAAPDELDLFLYFYEAGLYVAPDPQVMVAELPYVQAPRVADLRRRKSQGLAIITSRTDPLDAWHYAELDTERPRAKKPTLSGSPMTTLADELQTRRTYGWLSVGATLLSGSTKAQTDMLRIPKKLLASPRSDGNGRSYTVPIGSRLSDAWLLVWITRPPSHALSDVHQRARAYLRAKKYQWKLNRGAAFIYDEGTKELVDILYDGTLPTSDPAMDAAVTTLFPPDKMSSPPPPKQTSKTRSNKDKSKRKRR